MAQYHKRSVSFMFLVVLGVGFGLWKVIKKSQKDDRDQGCKIATMEDSDRVSQFIAVTRKLGLRRSAEGLRNFKPSSGTNLAILIILAEDIETNPGPRSRCNICKKFCKPSEKWVECADCEKHFHSSCCKLDNTALSELDSGFGTWYCTDCKADCGLCSGAVLYHHKAVQCDGCDMWIHTECSYISDEEYSILMTSNCSWICPKCEFRNQYDYDVTVWSPQGRIHQVEYAMEAVKQGSATVGLKSKTHAILVALKRAPSELSSHQKKILPVDDHLGIAIAGLTADARLLCNYMRSECLNSRYSYDQALPVSRLVTNIGNKSQLLTQRYGRRPFGVGLLVAGYDSQGPHIYQTCPSANYYDCKAMAIGARSQSARTYLEKHLDKFPDSNLEELIKHGLRSLRDTLPSEVNLTSKNCSLGVVGKDQDFTIYDDQDIEPYLAMIEGEERSSRPPPAPEGGAEGEQAMDDEGGDKDKDPQPANPQVEAQEPMDH